MPDLMSMMGLGSLFGVHTSTGMFFEHPTAARDAEREVKTCEERVKGLVEKVAWAMAAFDPFDNLKDDLEKPPATQPKPSCLAEACARYINVLL